MSSRPEFYVMWTSLRYWFAREWRTLSNPYAFGHERRKKQVTIGVGASLALGMATAMGVAPLTGGDADDGPKVSEALTMPATLAEQVKQLEKQTHSYMRQEQMRKGDTVADVLKRLSIQDPDAQSFIFRDSTARQLFSLRPGHILQARTDDDDNLLTLKALLDDSSSGSDAQSSRLLIIERVRGSAKPTFRANVVNQRNDIQHEMRSGTINGSFFAAMDDADVPETVVSQMIEIFSGVLDFHHDIRSGDRFRIVYESAYQNGSFVRSGRIVAIELINQGKVHQAVWYGNQPGGGSYYTFDGKSMRRAFLRSPLEFSRISSGFGGRSHPVWGDWRQHKGIDFSAPTGTRVQAAGDGTVDFAGWQNGYGNIVVINHRGGYSTHYAHLSGFGEGVQKGKSVSQGQLIGYVGATGWATGPHLHYEFRYNNQPLDPSTSAVVDIKPLAGRDYRQFQTYTADLMKRIDALRTFNVAATQF